jgi:hypothetical protein
MAEHPTPWKVGDVEYEGDGIAGIEILDAEGVMVAFVTSWKPPRSISHEVTDQDRARAEQIVRVVNAHERLVTALKEAESALSPDWVDGPRGEYKKCPACGSTDWCRVDHKPDCILLAIESALAAADGLP